MTPTPPLPQEKLITKILIADDHDLIRDGICGHLRGLGNGITFVEAGDWIETIAAAMVHPDLGLALVDLYMPGKAGLTGLAELLRANRGLPVLILSASGNMEDMREALRLGAMGYVSKSETAAVMLGAVRLVLDGGMYVPPALANLGTTIHAAPAPVLTERQLEVLRLIVQGKSNKEIARTLHLAHATVKVHLAAIFRLLAVENRTQAAIAAERLGLHCAPPADS